MTGFSAPIFKGRDATPRMEANLAGEIQKLEAPRVGDGEQVMGALTNSANMFLAIKDHEKKQQAYQQLIGKGAMGVMEYGRSRNIEEGKLGWVQSYANSEENIAKAYGMIDKLAEAQIAAAKNGEGKSYDSQALKVQEALANLPDDQRTLQKFNEIASEYELPATSIAYDRLYKNFPMKQEPKKDRVQVFEKISGVLQADAVLRDSTQKSMKYLNAVSDPVLKDVNNSFQLLVESLGAESAWGKLAVYGAKLAKDETDSLIDKIGQLVTKQQESVDRLPKEGRELYNQMITTLRQHLKQMSGATVTASEEAAYKTISGMGIMDPVAARQAMTQYLNNIMDGQEAITREKLTPYTDYLGGYANQRGNMSDSVLQNLLYPGNASGRVVGTTPTPNTPKQPVTPPPTVQPAQKPIIKPTGNKLLDIGDTYGD